MMEKFTTNLITYYSDFTFTETECYYYTVIESSKCNNWFKNFTNFYKEEFGDSFYTAWVSDTELRVYPGIDTFFTIAFIINEETV